MTTLHFLADWALRSSILILSGALVLFVLRVRDVSLRLAAWTAMLCGSLAIPVMIAALPQVAVTAIRVSPSPVAAVIGTFEGTFENAPMKTESSVAPASPPFDWARVGIAVYTFIAVVLLLRVLIGTAMSLRLLGGSRATGLGGDNVEILESDRIASPVTLGILKPAIVLPSDWSQWDSRKLNAVLAHERSHIGRYDPAVQLVSAIHRALLWHSPLSWLLHSRIVRLGECASDDAAVVISADRASYAEVLLGFMGRGGAVRGARWIGVPMARYGRADKRIRRILDGTALSGGVTRWSIVGIIALGMPIAYVAAMAHPAVSARAPIAAVLAPAVSVVPGARQVAQAVAHPPVAKQTPQHTQPYLAGLGTVTAVTVTVRTRTDGELMSVNFREGELVQAGEILASIDPRSQPELQEAERQVDFDNNQAALAKDDGVPRAALQAAADRAMAEQARVSYLKEQTQIKAPITGRAGLRLAEPGQSVRASDPGGIVVITQVQPIAVVFTLPEGVLPQVRPRLEAGERPVVEVWNRDFTAQLAAGILTATDNQIDMQSGTVKLKAMFDNKDGALFPNQFVNVRLLDSSR